jgi:hypothetical protein
MTLKIQINLASWSMPRRSTASQRRRTRIGTLSRLSFICSLQEQPGVRLRRTGHFPSNPPLTATWSQRHFERTAADA